MGIKFSGNVIQKLRQKHGVTTSDVLDCFANRDGDCLIDDREDHQTDPPSQWFIAETNYGVELKIVFIQLENGEIHIKTAYRANNEEKRIYNKYGY